VGVFCDLQQEQAYPRRQWYNDTWKFAICLSNI